MVDRTHRELTDDDIAQIADTYHAWRSQSADDAGDEASESTAGHQDVAGFCKRAPLEEIRGYDHVLTPGRYVGIAPEPDDGEPFADKMNRLAAQWRDQQAEAAKLDTQIEANLQSLGF